MVAKVVVVSHLTVSEGVPNLLYMLTVLSAKPVLSTAVEGHLGWQHL